MSSKGPNRPLIAIVGATGTGKSQLAVSLAQRFDGEVINGDALQIYHGLPIITNKMPLAERQGVEHHLLGRIKPDEDPWTVKQFVDHASSIIEEIRSRGKLPILVGGTHYYTQSLLLQDAVVSDQSPSTSEESGQAWPILESSTENIMDELRRVDPAMAARWHPNDRRKIRRSLEIFLTTGKKASDVYEQQQRSQEGEKLNDPCDNSEDQARVTSKDQSRSTLRFDSLVLWNYASTDILNARLEERVDQMILNGLLDEVRLMHDLFQSFNERGSSLDQDRGIWVAIGFKEFLPYIRDRGERQDLRIEAIERTKIATRQYAKRQVRWIRLRLQRAIYVANAQHHMFLLDASNLSQWREDVERKALEITAKFIGGDVLPDPCSTSNAARDMLINTVAPPKSARSCDACGKTLMSEPEWIGHLKSKGHKSATRPKIDWKTLYPEKHTG